MSVSSNQPVGKLTVVEEPQPVGALTVVDEAQPVGKLTPVEEQPAPSAVPDYSHTPAMQSGFTSLIDSEGVDIHVDGREILTLPYGIVPDKGSVKKLDGATFDPRKGHGFKAGDDLSGIDYSGAIKFGVKRVDFSSDRLFAEAVYKKFADETHDKLRANANLSTPVEKLPDAALEAAYDLSWNIGTGAAKWGSVGIMLEEASKEGARDKDKLIGFVGNFRSGAQWPRGLLKRRLMTYNLVANTEDVAATVRTEASLDKQGKRVGTVYSVLREDGTLLKEYTKAVTNEKLGDLKVDDKQGFLNK